MRDVHILIQGVRSTTVERASEVTLAGIRRDGVGSTPMGGKLRRQLIVYFFGVGDRFHCFLRVDKRCHCRNH